MSAGTIALTNGSTTVSGSGTSFTTELRPGDFIYVMVGGAPYTLVASAIGSVTRVTLATAYDGPTASGLAWVAAPALMQAAVTQKILNDFAAVARGRVLDFQNWQKIYSSDASVTVTRPDRTTFTGPSWGYLADQLKGKARSDDRRFDTVDGKTGGNVEGQIRVSGGSSIGVKTGAGGNKDIYLYNAVGDGDVSTFVNFLRGFWYDGVWTLGGVRGDDTRLSHAQMSVSSGAGAAADFLFYPDGRAIGNWQMQSDERIKEIYGFIDNPLEKMRGIRGIHFRRLDTGLPGYGFSAQAVGEVFPDAVSKTGQVTLQDGTVVKDVLSPDTYGVSAALHHEAILALMDRIEELEKRLNGTDALDE